VSIFNLSYFLFPFFFSLHLTPLAIRLAKKIGFYDIPDGLGLKIHKSPTPNIGGIVLFTSFFATLLFLSLFSGINRPIYWLAILSFFIIILGVIDDFKGINSFIRLLFYSIIAIVSAKAGLCYKGFQYDWINIFTSWLLIVGCINAINMLDGMDGLAAGVSAICCLGFLVLSIIQKNPIILPITLIFLGAVLGFLPYNFYPAKVFLGNSGSTLIGFFMGIFVITAGSNDASILKLIPPLLIASIPLMDMELAVSRRIRNRRGLFTGDREHFYDKLMKKGFSQRKTAFIAYGMTAVSVILAIFFQILMGVEP
jgi:UDP-GlcNAc:undecaprenyl-phosphate GlcNAc-1-phosphate transferase